MGKIVGKASQKPTKMELLSKNRAIKPREVIVLNVEDVLKQDYEKLRETRIYPAFKAKIMNSIPIKTMAVAPNHPLGGEIRGEALEAETGVPNG